MDVPSPPPPLAVKLLQLVARHPIQIFRGDAERIVYGGGGGGDESVGDVVVVGTREGGAFHLELFLARLRVVLRGSPRLSQTQLQRRAGSHRQRAKLGVGSRLFPRVVPASDRFIRSTVNREALDRASASCFICHIRVVYARARKVVAVARREIETDEFNYHKA